MERFKMLGCIYVFPLFFCFVFQFMDGLQFNGVDANGLSKVIFGFALGMALEGFVFIFFGTVAIIIGRFDK
ncbi:TMhelix containing protein [Vibrio phage 1.047.O._10N.286.55.F2]|nr:TMhelix containing protein [Vibrio phage 1.047.O._10N.286.55.F2]